MYRVVVKEEIEAIDENTKKKLKEEFYGYSKGSKVFVLPEECLYLANFKKLKVFDKSGREIKIKELFRRFSKKKKLFERYNTLRDWRDRGLVLRKFNRSVKSKHGNKIVVKYPSEDVKYENVNSEAVFIKESMVSILFENTIGRKLYENYWFGQYGIYKQNRGDLLKLDFIETLFCMKHLNMKVFDETSGKKMKWKELLEFCSNKREYTDVLYGVYEDWRLRGYIVKSGFKFGSHFRIYFPGATPMQNSKWLHSKHVLHVFPKNRKMVVSEWARAVRVAHGVKKTFIICVPEVKKTEMLDIDGDFLGYRRKVENGKIVRETPRDKARYIIFSIREDTEIGGIELASLLNLAMEMGTNLLLSITDRDTALTYYLLKKIVLPGSKYDYYEIEWF